MSYEVIDTTNDIDPITTTKKVVMAIKTVKRIKDKWAEFDYLIGVNTPRFNNNGNVSHWTVSLTSTSSREQSVIDIKYDLYSNPSSPNYNISAYTYIKGYKEPRIFRWNEHLLSLLNEQINCIDDAICILEHFDEMLA